MTPVSATLDPAAVESYLGADPVGTRFAAMNRGGWTPATLAHHLSMPLAKVMPVLRNECEDAATIKLVDAALGLLPDVAPEIPDDPESPETEDDHDFPLPAPCSLLPAPCSPPSASDDPDYLAELEAARAEDETLHALPAEPDYSSGRAALTVALFDVLRESAGEITLESIDRDMKAPRGTARNVLLGDARHAKVEDFLCWLTDMQREQCWPPDGEALRKPWPRAGRRTRLLSPVSRPMSPVSPNPKGPRT